MANRAPLQNRVTPFGDVVSDPSRGTLMGNRGGGMHDTDQRLRPRHWVNERWICCLLEFKGWHREVMTPGRYTELFFLDEATALAAGHRPCAECRRADFQAFRAAWIRGNPGAGVSPGDGITALDRVLHAERLARPRPLAPQLASLPPGTVVAAPSGEALLWWQGRAWRWSFEGYSPVPTPPGGPLLLLTPPSVVAALEAGYLSAVHHTAGAPA